MTLARSNRALRFTCVAMVAGLLYAAGAQAEPPAASTEPPAAATETPAADAKPQRPPIYDPEADGKELIAAASKLARLEGKRVLVEWGGNWCGWCHKLHDVFKNDELVSPIVAEEYVLVLVDSTKNRELMQSYGGKDRSYAYPHLTILDPQGNVLTNQETGSLEIGPKHDPEAVANFLKKWQPETVNADDLLAASLRAATEQDKRILVHVGTPYCGWCKVLTAFLDDHAKILSDDYVDLRLDTMRMKNGKEVAGRFEPEGSEGVPWMVILDGSGKVLATSIGPKGNCGYPASPEEIDHFLSMLSGTKQRLKDADLQTLRADLNAYRIEREARQAKQSQ